MKSAVSVRFVPVSIFCSSASRVAGDGGVPVSRSYMRFACARLVASAVANCGAAANAIVTNAVSVILADSDRRQPMRSPLFVLFIVLMPGPEFLVDLLQNRCI